GLPLCIERLQGRRILLAEDNRVNQHVIRRMLEKHGCVVEVASDGRLAVECCRQDRFDLVLMDLQMPILDGFAATAEIRQLPGGALLPIVALTAHAMRGDRERCLAAGLDDYVPKPIQQQHLLATMLGLLN
ncbi:MAG: response regulator, partial [Bdellovibrionales bacterium]|nr:response regulator [Bdellovibrionales bacterium]